MSTKEDKGKLMKDLTIIMIMTMIITTTINKEIIETIDQETNNNKVTYKIMGVKEYKNNGDPITIMKGEIDKHKPKGKEKITKYNSQKDLNQTIKFKKRIRHKITKNK